MWLLTVYNFHLKLRRKGILHDVKTVNMLSSKHRYWEVLHSDWLVWGHCHWRRSLHLGTSCLWMKAVWWLLPSAQRCHRNVTHPCRCAGALGLLHLVLPALSLLICKITVCNSLLAQRSFSVLWIWIWIRIRIWIRICVVRRCLRLCWPTFLQGTCDHLVLSF